MLHLKLNRKTDVLRDHGVARHAVLFEGVENLSQKESICLQNDITLLKLYDMETTKQTNTTQRAKHVQHISEPLRELMQLYKLDKKTAISVYYGWRSEL